MLGAKKGVSPLLCAMDAPSLRGRSCTKRLEGGAQFRAEKPRLFPGCEVAALVDPVEVDEFMIRPLGPAPRRLKALAREDGYGSRDRDVGSEVKVDLVFPNEARRRNACIRQPVERDVVEHVVPRKVTCGVSIDRAPEDGRGDRRRRLGIAVTVVEQPGGEAGVSPPVRTVFAGASP